MTTTKRSAHAQVQAYLHSSRIRHEANNTQTTCAGRLQMCKMVRGYSGLGLHNTSFVRIQCNGQHV